MIPLAELPLRGIHLTAPEAVAIVQKLIDGDVIFDAQPPFELPNANNLLLDESGSIMCRGGEATPSPFEAAILLQTLMPSGIVRAPGGLRYAIARALLEVDAAPFDSLHDFSRALARFEEGDRGAALRNVVARLGGVDRRRGAPSAGELRLALREADRQVYELRMAMLGAAAASRRPLVRILRAPIAAGLAAGLALVAAGQLMQGGRQTAGGAAPVTAIATADREGSAAAASDLPRSQVGPFVGELHAAGRGSLPQRSGDAHNEADGVVVRALDDQRRPVFSPAFASNGTALFFHSGAANVRSALMAAEQSGGDLHVMTIVDDGARNYHVQPSPDGRLIAFDSDRDGDRGVYVAGRDGTGVRRVSGAGYAAVPTWSPDGGRLAFIRAEPANAKVWNLWLLSLQSGALQRLTSFRYGQTWGGSWFPDGDRIAFTHEDVLAVLDLESGRLREFRTPVAGRLVRTAAVSPDGSRIIFQVYRDGGWLLELSDGSMRRVLTDPTAEEFAWSRDGHRVAFHSRRDGEWGIWMLGGV